jgi:hypothetical protein
MLRFMAWLCLKDNALSGSQMCIVTGPRIDLAIALIDRMKKLFVVDSSKGLIAFEVISPPLNIVEQMLSELSEFTPIAIMILLLLIYYALSH